MSGFKSIRSVAQEYFGDDALMWGAGLESLGRRLDENHISYYEYFAYLIRQYNDLARYKGTMLSERVFDKYKEYRSEASRVAELNAYLDSEAFETNVDTNGRNPEDVLLDEGVELTQLFRYVMALTLGYYKLAPKFQDAAVMQLKENTEYFRTFSKFHNVFPVKKEDVVRE
jgi:hypothetical protein